MKTVAALFVDEEGCYASARGVIVYGISKDARTYDGPHPVVAHPPCQRWGKYYGGPMQDPHRYKKGMDVGCFASALTCVRNFGGVLEHPANSHAWSWFGLNKPPAAGGWIPADHFGGWTCCVDQGKYGHFANKPTWLYAVGQKARPKLRWGRGDQRLPQWMIDRYGYEKARKIGLMAMIGGKNKTRIREATPPKFRNLLLRMARQVLS